MFYKKVKIVKIFQQMQYALSLNLHMVLVYLHLSLNMRSSKNSTPKTGLHLKENYSHYSKEKEHWKKLYLQLEMLYQVQHPSRLKVIFFDPRAKGQLIPKLHLALRDTLVTVSVLAP